MSKKLAPRRVSGGMKVKTNIKAGQKYVKDRGPTESHSQAEPAVP